MSTLHQRTVAAARPIDRYLFQPFWRPFDWLALALQVRAQRRELLGLSDAMLKDIGISRADAQREANRPFWDLPLDVRGERATQQTCYERQVGAASVPC